jgi:hypothetical protein
MILLDTAGASVGGCLTCATQGSGLLCIELNVCAFLTSVVFPLVCPKLFLLPGLKLRVTLFFNLA